MGACGCEYPAEGILMPAGVLESITLLDRAGETLLETYGRRVEDSSDLALDALTGYNETRDLYDVPWSPGLRDAMPSLSRAVRGGVTYVVERSVRRDQRNVRLTLGGVA